MAVLAGASLPASAICHPQPDCQDTPPRQIKNAQFIGQTVPATMTSGQTYSVTVVMKNTGTVSWNSADGVKLGVQNAPDNSTWGRTRVLLPASIAPDETVSFTFPVVAPAAFSGRTYNFQWQMLQEGVVWFGAMTPNVAVVVPAAVVTDSYRRQVEYDEVGQVIVVRGNSGQNSRFTYSPDGDMTAEIDSLGKATTATYGPMGELVSLTDPTNSKTSFEYNAAGQLLKTTDARGLVTAYQKDGFGAIWQQTSPDTGVTQYAYDSAGRPVSATKGVGTPDAIATSYVYDSIGRISSIASGAMANTFSFDGCSNGKGRLCSVTDSYGSLSFSYTPQGQVSSQVSVVGSGALTFNSQYTYDPQGRLATLTYPDGTQVTYSYVSGKLSGASAKIGATTYAILSNLKYEPQGPANEWTYGNGLVRRTAYDIDGRVSSIVTTGAPGMQSLSYSYNVNDKLVSVTNGRNAALNQVYAYDAAGRLAVFPNTTGAATSVAYDGVGNRTQRTDSTSATQVFSYASTSNRLLFASGAPGRVWAYDGRGNVTGFTGEDGFAVGLHYNAFDRIDSSSRNGIATSYYVNALGQRTYKSTSGGTTSAFTYTPEGNLLAEYNVGNGQWTNYLWAGNQLVGLARGGAVYFVHSDHLGRPEVVTNVNKVIVWSANLGAFSRQVATDAIGGMNIGYPGQYYDSETGTWNNRFRDYDASTGRYLQSDPLGLSGGANTYAYAGGNPVSAIDPLGLYCYSEGKIRFIAGAVTGALGTGIATSEFGPEVAIPLAIVGGLANGVLNAYSEEVNNDPSNGNMSALGAGALGGLEAHPGGGVAGGLVGAYAGERMEAAGYGREATTVVSGAAGGYAGSVIYDFVTGTGKELLLNSLKGGLKAGAIGAALGLFQVGLEAGLRAGNDCGCGGTKK
jgi:RHS repeat-associated protein